MTTDSSNPTRTSSPRRGVDGALIRMWGGKDLRLRVIDREEVAENFVRLKVDLDGLLARDAVYPTYWLRLWFTTPAGKGHQRGYTLVDPDPAEGTACIEFYLHPGIASDWARGATAGDEIDATVLNGRNPVAETPTHLVMVGDGASYPAIADTLRRLPEVPATVLLERGYADDEQVLTLPAREGLSMRWIDRDGSLVHTALATAGAAPTGSTFFVALEGAPTRALTSGLRRQLAVPKERIHSLAYWKKS
ncbi:siderophore-interacting protein [Brachybacterium alimentarium]|uniref:siderophore-interacting protein n=1 Tax=Brachybacterium alimentarium TaxID=47845 RepID=UPI000BB68DFC|nr:siderophore-interacting protein [Brachybacterium alimentarium]PCC33915.1 hypothetical protein CIK71_07240 [Brachybacterium alimentarium]RCS62642.1 siderophore-interacting protein [Brachybacterium alimentarium]RCS87783.1 siderophore-interacting protein [Brachybacterium alimentarium]RCS88027.1 siderophore-interacting protein [Brachybacterium alimentarium]